MYWLTEFLNRELGDLGLQYHAVRKCSFQIVTDETIVDNLQRNLNKSHYKDSLFHTYTSITISSDTASLKSNPPNSYLIRKV
jgi:hypothetical protein